MNMTALIARLREATPTSHPFTGHPFTDSIGAEIAAYFHATADYMEAVHSTGSPDGLPLLSATFDVLATSVENTTEAGPLASLLALLGISDADVAAASAAGHTFEEDCPACAAAEAEETGETSTGFDL